MIPHGQVYPYQCQNFFSGVKDPIQAICLHGTAAKQARGALQAALATLTNPRYDNPDAAVSSNYVIAKNGEIYFLVDWRAGRRAWANGPVKAPDKRIAWLLFAVQKKVNINRLTISIEHEATDEEMKRSAPMPDAQFNSSTWLVLSLLQELGLPINDQTVIGHRQINSVDKAYCPGVIDIPAYIEVLKLRENML